MALINVTTSVQIQGGPQQSFSRAIDVEAYGRIEATVPAAASAAGVVTVEVQPSGDVTQVQFLLITASQYGDQLTYSAAGLDGEATSEATSEANGGNGGVADVTLDAPQLFLGPAAVGLLQVAPQSITFSNSSSDPITVVILVGRDATPP